MTNPEQSQNYAADRRLEELLKNAPPRPMPSAEALARARQALKADWQQLSGRRKLRRRMVLLATAATITIAAVLSTGHWLVPSPEPVEVAEVGRTTGAVFVMGEKSELQEVPELASVVTGQTVRTGPDAAMGLNWLRGGSLRLDEKTEVTFVTDDRIELSSGRVYFDSESGSSALTIGTRYGDIQHLGTQYMARADAKALTVSVRDGRVAIHTFRGEEIAEPGQQLTIVDSLRGPRRLNISVYGPNWEWIEAVATPPLLRGKTIYDVLLWVSHETGLKFDFADTETEILVHRESIEGDLSASPRIALRQSLLTANLHSNIDDASVAKSGVIVIRR
ncbi:MAG TPA: FecR family protein [Woeseiaceae bacterium]|nr:FecR family protein [Woeseiaceae bacterium]